MSVLPWRCVGDLMSELRLDYQHNLPFPWAGTVLLALAMLALILTGTYYLKLSGQAASWESKAERIQNRGAQHELAGRSTEHGAVELAQEVNNANDVLRQMNVPWEVLFQAVESSGGNKVTLLALEPDIEKRQVKINGETKNFKALMNYITQLEGQDVFGSVYLQSHHVQQQDPDRPVRFSLLAMWQEKP
jgi:hypothetical protein